MSALGENQFHTDRDYLWLPKVKLKLTHALYCKVILTLRFLMVIAVKNGRASTQTLQNVVTLGDSHIPNWVVS